MRSLPPLGLGGSSGSSGSISALRCAGLNHIATCTMPQDMPVASAHQFVCSPSLSCRSSGPARSRLAFPVASDPVGRDGRQSSIENTT
jgi:hypothetical protein